METIKLVGTYQSSEPLIIMEVPVEAKQVAVHKALVYIDTKDWVLWWEDCNGNRELVPTKN